MSRIKHETIEEKKVISHKDMHGIVLDFGPTHFFPAEPFRTLTSSQRQKQLQKASDELKGDLGTKLIEIIREKKKGFTTPIEGHIKAAKLIQKTFGFQKKGYRIKHKKQKELVMKLFRNVNISDKDIYKQIVGVINLAQNKQKELDETSEKNIKDLHKTIEEHFMWLACILNESLEEYMKPIGKMRGKISKPTYEDQNKLIQAFTIKITCNRRGAAGEPSTLDLKNAINYHLFCKPMNYENIHDITLSFPDIVKRLKEIQVFLKQNECQKKWKGTARMSRNDMIGAKYLWNKYMFEYGKCTLNGDEYQSKINQINIHARKLQAAGRHMMRAKHARDNAAKQAHKKAKKDGGGYV